MPQCPKRRPVGRKGQGKWTLERKNGATMSKKAVARTGRPGERYEKLELERKNMKKPLLALLKK